MPTKVIASLAAFGKEVVGNQRQMGCVAPSSPMLAQRMARMLPANFSGVVIELGAGTGAITAALLQRGVVPENLFALEQSPQLVRHLARRFPAVRVMKGDAEDFRPLLPRDVRRDGVDYIISSLPLRRMNPKKVARIIEQIRKTLTPKGRFIQYTYNLQKNRHRELSSLELCYSSVVWLNLPPARVNVFRPNGHASAFESAAESEPATHSPVPTLML